MSDEQKTTLTKAELQEKVEQLTNDIETLIADTSAMKESMSALESAIEKLKGHINIERGGIIRKGPVKPQLSELDEE